MFLLQVAARERWGSPERNQSSSRHGKNVCNTPCAALGRESGLQSKRPDLTTRRAIGGVWQGGAGKPRDTAGHWAPKQYSSSHCLLWIKWMSTGKEAEIQVIIKEALAKETKGHWCTPCYMCVSLTESFKVK